MNPWITIWTSPRSTIRSIVDTNANKSFWLLAIIYGFQTLLYTANYGSYGAYYNPFLIFFLSLIISPIIGGIWLYIGSWILKLSGLIFKGGAPITHVRAAFSWSKVPLLINILLWIILLIFTQQSVFLKDGSQYGTVFVNLLSIASGVWCVVLVVQNIREVQGFNIWKAIGNVVIAWAISLILFFALGYVYSLFA